MSRLQTQLVKYGTAFKGLFDGKYSLVANTGSSAILFLIGDGIEQRIEIHRGEHHSFDWGRFGRMGTIGLVEGPLHHYFYTYLDKIWPQRNAKTISKKILTDQLIACPMFGVTFFMGMAFLEGKNFAGCWSEFKTKFPTVYLVDWLLWPPFQLVNFYLIPPGFRVLYVNSVTVFWNIFLSYMKHYDQVDENATKTKAIIHSSNSGNVPGDKGESSHLSKLSDTQSK